MNKPPLIQIDFQHLKHSVVQCFNEVQLQTDEQFRRAVENAFEPKKIETLINEKVEYHIKSLIESEIQSYFSYQSDGKAIIKERIREKLDEMFE